MEIGVRGHTAASTQGIRIYRHEQPTQHQRDNEALLYVDRIAHKVPYT